MVSLKIITAGFLLSFFNLVGAQQENRTTCIETKRFFDFLKDEYKEVPVLAATYNNKIITIWINRKTKTATIVLSDPVSGQSCLVADLIDAKMIDSFTGT